MNQARSEGSLLAFPAKQERENPGNEVGCNQRLGSVGEHVRLP